MRCCPPSNEILLPVVDATEIRNATALTLKVYANKTADFEVDSKSLRLVAEKVAAMFEATSNIGDWDGAAKLTPIDEMLGVSDVVMRFRVTPGTSAPSAFLRIRK